MEYAVFKVDGTFVFTVSDTPIGYVNNPEYTVVKTENLVPGFQYSLISGKIVKGNPDPEITEE